MRGLRQTRYRRPPHRTTSTRAQNIRLGASSRYRRAVPQHRRDFPPAVDPAQLDLPARHKAEEQDERGVFARQGALRLHAASEFSVKSLDHVCRAQRLPLLFGEGEEREELVAAFPQARHHARTTFDPRALERRVSSAGRERPYTVRRGGVAFNVGRSGRGPTRKEYVRGGTSRGLTRQAILAVTRGS